MAEPMEILGSMSGTSMDGVDAAVLVTDGERILGFGPTAFRPYREAERAALRAALGRWPGEPGVEAAATVVVAAHAEALAPLPGEVVALHGQTLAHEPRGRGTHQAGDGARLAAALGRTVVWDFRTGDVAAGGEGAPLAPAYHFACARWAGLREPVAFLNLGGVANLTWLDPRAEAPEAPGALLAFDTGPASAPLDDLMAARLGRPFDEGGALAATGTVDERVIEAMPPLAAEGERPRSLDRGDFAALSAAVEGLSDARAAATLTAAAAEGVARGLALCPTRPRRLLVTGGGRRNGAMMAAVAERCGLRAEPVEALGLDGDMLEAQAFAFLAARVLRGLPTSFPGTTGVRRPVTGGRVDGVPGREGARRIAAGGR